MKSQSMWHAESSLHCFLCELKPLVLEQYHEYAKPQRNVRLKDFKLGHINIVYEWRETMWPFSKIHKNKVFIILEI